MKIDCIKFLNNINSLKRKMYDAQCTIDGFIKLLDSLEKSTDDLGLKSDDVECNISETSNCIYSCKSAISEAITLLEETEELFENEIDEENEKAESSD